MGQFSFAAQEEVEALLRAGELPASGTLLCLRRKPPGWWFEVPSSFPHLSLQHFPIPPSVDGECARLIEALCSEAIPGMKLPILVFCKEGRHRSGMVEAIISLQRGAALKTALERYTRRARGGARAREIDIIRQLSGKLHSADHCRS
jgi:hypothetical protein